MRGILFLFGFLAFVALGIALATTYTVDEGETGVILTNGAISGEATSGRHFKNPLFDDVIYISNRAQTYQFQNVQAYSLDQQVGTLQLSVTFSVPRAQSKDIYARYGSIDSFVSRVVSPRTQTVFKTIFGKTTALKATSEQDKLLVLFKDELQTAIGDEAVLESVQIENLDFSDKYEENVEARASAEVKVLTQKQVLEEEKVKATILTTQAQAEADSSLSKARAAAEGTLAQAEAEAKAIKLRGDAEAWAIEAKGKALRDNPGVVQLTLAESWKGVLPTTMIPGASVPLLNLEAVK